MARVWNKVKKYTPSDDDDCCFEISMILLLKVVESERKSWLLFCE